MKWAGADLNRRHTDFQSVALPTELPALIHCTLHPNGQDDKKIKRKLRNFDYLVKNPFTDTASK